MDREVRYCTTDDGVRIAYSVEGEGRPLIVFSTAFSAFSLLEEVPSFRHFLRKLGEARSLIRFDSRGIGLSQRDVADFSRGTLSLDVLAVMDALGLERTSLLAAGPIAGTALHFSATYPERVAALVTFGGLARVPDRQWYER